MEIFLACAGISLEQADYNTNNRSKRFERFRCNADNIQEAGDLYHYEVCIPIGSENNSEPLDHHYTIKPSNAT